jgi:hypothetical protein
MGALAAEHVSSTGDGTLNPKERIIKITLYLLEKISTIYTSCLKKGKQKNIAYKKENVIVWNNQTIILSS